MRSKVLVTGGCGFIGSFVTNAFKAYRREVIEGCQPFLSPHINLSVENSSKAIVRGYSFEVLPISWRNRSVGISKLKIREMGSRYLFIVIYVLLEKWLTGKEHWRLEKKVVKPQ